MLSDSREVPETRQEDSPLDLLGLGPVQDGRLREGLAGRSPVMEHRVTLISRTPMGRPRGSGWRGRVRGVLGGRN